MPLWIDTDMGFDDLMAILLLQHAGLKIDGVSLVAGNTPIEQVARNAVAAAESFGWLWPIHLGATQPLQAKAETAETILGYTGMQSAGVQLPVPDDTSMKILTQVDAMQALQEWLDDLDEPATILALGPLTNIAHLVKARPDLKEKISQLVWMGGSAGTGNHTSFAEFNAYVDPEAVDIVLRSGLPLRMVGLDVCRTVTFAPQDSAGLRTAAGKNARLLSDLLEGYIGIATSRGREAMAVYDPTAAAAIADPETVSFIPAYMRIHPTDTEKRGMTEIEPAPQAPPNILLADETDSARIRSLTLQALQAEAER